MWIEKQLYLYIFTYLGDSPRIAVHKKEELPDINPPSCKPTKKDQISLPNAKLPPRPQGLPIYKMPPRPNYHVPVNVSGINRSIEVSQRDSSK